MRSFREDTVSRCRDPSDVLSDRSLSKEPSAVSARCFSAASSREEANSASDNFLSSTVTCACKALFNTYHKFNGSNAFTVNDIVSCNNAKKTADKCTFKSSLLRDASVALESNWLHALPSSTALSVVRIRASFVLSSSLEGKIKTILTNNQHGALLQHV